MTSRQNAFLRRATRPLPQTRIQRASSIFTALSITYCVMYAVFSADWGEGENVFSPARRWGERQKRAFWTLSPEERAAAAQLSFSEPPSSSNPEKS